MKVKPVLATTGSWGATASRWETLGAMARAACKYDGIGGVSGGNIGGRGRREGNLFAPPAGARVDTTSTHPPLPGIVEKKKNSKQRESGLWGHPLNPGADRER